MKHFIPLTQHHDSVFSPYHVGTQFLLAGRTIDDWVAIAGQTPFFIYSGAQSKQTILDMRCCLPEGLNLHYALKANPHTQLISAIANWVDGLDVTSLSELQTALNSGMSAGSISVTGPAKPDTLLRAAIAAGALIVAESVAQVIRIDQLAQEHGRCARVLLRLNDGQAAHGMGMFMSGAPSVFGMSFEDARELLLDWSQFPHSQFWGLHLFAGSQNLSAEQLSTQFSMNLHVFMQLCDCMPSPPQLLNFGGGLGIVYRQQDAPLDLKAYGQMITPAVAQAKEVFPQAQLCLELGRYLVGPAGIYVTRVVEKKYNQGKYFLVTDGGLHHFQAATGHFGQVVRQNFPLALIQSQPNSQTHMADITGLLCTPMDILAANISISNVNIGDLLLVFQAGAYGLSASPVSFLSQRKAKELFIVE